MTNPNIELIRPMSPITALPNNLGKYYYEFNFILYIDKIGDRKLKLDRKDTIL